MDIYSAEKKWERVDLICFLLSSTKDALLASKISISWKLLTWNGRRLHYKIPFTVQDGLWIRNSYVKFTLWIAFKKKISDKNLFVREFIFWKWILNFLWSSFETGGRCQIHKIHLSTYSTSGVLNVYCLLKIPVFVQYYNHCVCTTCASDAPQLCHWGRGRAEVTCCWGRGLRLDEAGAGWWLESLQSRLQPSSPDILQWQTPARDHTPATLTSIQVRGQHHQRIYNIVLDW